MPIQCRLCGKDFRRISFTHVKGHGITLATYKEQFPDAPILDPELTKEIADKIGAAHRDPAVRASKAAKMSAMPRSATWRQRISEGQKGKVISAETRAKASKSAKARFERDGAIIDQPGAREAQKATMETPEYRMNHALGQASAALAKDIDGINKRLSDELTLRAIPHTREYVTADASRFDFAFTESYTLLEVHGCRWHSCPEHPETHENILPDRKEKRRLKDASKRIAAEAEGWSYVAVWEHQIKRQEDLVAWVRDFLVPML
jgi:G:T-mismatch repair DNA endonuclease (very short patch repair protein)